MDLLLVTHTFIWFFNGDNNLPKHSRTLIENTTNKCFISIASIWEIAIKQSIGKLELAKKFNHIIDFIDNNDITILPIIFKHTQELINLKFHHRDPFDRIIICQAIVENISIITKDENFHKYSINIIWDK